MLAGLFLNSPRLERHPPVAHQSLLKAVAADLGGIGQAHGLLCRECQVEPGVQGEAVTVKGGAFDAEVTVEAWSFYQG